VRDRGRGAADAVERPQDRAADEQGRAEGRGRGAGGDEQDVEVVLRVEHDDAREEHCRERERDGDEPEAGELETHGGEPSQRERGQEPCRERAQRDDDREWDHGVNR
jgi:hypothetical protein